MCATLTESNIFCSRSSRRIVLLTLLMFAYLTGVSVCSSGQTVANNGQAINDRISTLQEQLRQEQEAATNDDATSRQFLQQQYAMAGLSGSAGATISQLDATLAQSASGSANAHRARAQQLQTEIYALNQQLWGLNSGSAFRTATPSGMQRFSLSSTATAWSESFFGGALTLSPNRVRYDDRDNHGNARKDSFDATCSELKEWKPNKINFMNAFAGPYPQTWEFHIKLKTGKHTDFMATTDIEMETILRAVSRACAAN
jgi:hypothetical protein